MFKQTIFLLFVICEITVDCFQIDVFICLSSEHRNELQLWEGKKKKERKIMYETQGRHEMKLFGLTFIVMK